MKSSGKTQTQLSPLSMLIPAVYHSRAWIHLALCRYLANTVRLNKTFIFKYNFTEM